MNKDGVLAVNIFCIQKLAYKNHLIGRPFQTLYTI